ncbi:DUF3078 domain-containing protein [Maribacter algarum]|uniref:DUF3078 domain-containing protein n=1 Tax=Maribacter algarum (ex Zhang et al. 2020) TaxID=2578118 RepID=A0A5S3PUZ9_9FLAO|nr:DUF3078 domain-containing protein [Maribacter algarum]TMM58831.1 DUF3078 domain-containing protein [Maribacter algarum]
MKKLIFVALTVFAGAFTYSQDDTKKAEELKAMLGPKADSIAAIQGRIDAIQGEIDGLPGWRKGIFGTIGANLSGSNNWYQQATPNNSAGNIGIALNGFANLKKEKYFWNNSANVNLQWVKLQDKDAENPAEDADKFNPTTDVINFTSLFGYNLSKKFAVSALGEFRSSINEFNNPGYLDIGIGATWLPIEGMVVVVHPLNYNFIFAEEDAAYESSTGAKIVVDYTRQLGAVNFKSNFSTFQSYKSGDLSNWNWINSFGYTLWKGIGLGFEFGLRGNKQESFALGANPGATLATTDANTQSYWLFGLNYSL